MAKTYVDTVKYVINAEFEIKGVVEKPDIIGAIFGQTEGLLGDELDLRELQKSGRIGRIEVELKTDRGKTLGTITVPSSLGKIETGLIAAALETVERIGPCEARIKVTSVEDTRTKKRQYVIDRAKEILKRMMEKQVPETKELTELVREEIKTSEILEWGPEKLPAGPAVNSSDDIIVVEGRADVLNLLKYDIDNIVSLQGKNIPKSVVELSHRKTVTLFLDGDRGGDLIVKNFLEAGGEPDFVAKAPDGKEVEELTQKEVLKSLRRKMPLAEFMSHTFKDYEPEHKKHDKKYNQDKQEHQKGSDELGMMEKTLNELNGTLKAVLFDKNMKQVKEVPVKELAATLDKEKGVHAVVLDGIVTQRLIDIANRKNIKYIVAVKQGNIRRTGKVEVYTAE